MSAWLAFGLGVVVGVALVNVIAIWLLPVFRKRHQAARFHVSGGTPERKT